MKLNESTVSKVGAWEDEERFWKGASLSMNTHSLYGEVAIMTEEQE